MFPFVFRSLSFVSLILFCQRIRNALEKVHFQFVRCTGYAGYGYEMTFSTIFQNLDARRGARFVVSPYCHLHGCRQQNFVRHAALEGIISE